MDTDKRLHMGPRGISVLLEEEEFRQTWPGGNAVILIRVEPITSPGLRTDPGMANFHGTVAAKLKRDCLHLPELL